MEAIRYAILNTEQNRFYGDETSTDLAATKAAASALNAAMKPEFQCYTVATIVLNPEV